MNTISFSPPPAMAASPLFEAARAVCQRLQSQGHECWVVGGGVRDTLLRPDALPGDLDLATSAHPAQLKALFPKLHWVGKSFGVSLLEWGGHSFELATFRKEGGYEDGRHPTEVAWGTRDEDAQRRDFTCNALYWDIVSHVIWDPFGGMEDIRHKVIRSVGAATDRFEEDALRILRLYRFAGGLGFSIDAATEGAAHEKKAGLAKISRERVLMEVQKLREGGLETFLVALSDGYFEPLFGCKKPTPAKEKTRFLFNSIFSWKDSHPALVWCLWGWEHWQEEDRHSWTKVWEKGWPLSREEASLLKIYPVWVEAAAAAASWESLAQLLPLMQRAATVPAALWQALAQGHLAAIEAKKGHGSKGPLFEVLSSGSFWEGSETLSQRLQQLPPWGWMEDVKRSPAVAGVAATELGGLVWRQKALQILSRVEAFAALWGQVAGAFPSASPLEGVGGLRNFSAPC